MSEYTKIKELDGWKGEAWLIEVDNKYYAVSRANTFDRGDETMIFSCDKNGENIDFTDLYAGYGEDHKTAINNWLGVKNE